MRRGSKSFRKPAALQVTAGEDELVVSLCALSGAIRLAVKQLGRAEKGQPIARFLKAEGTLYAEDGRIPRLQERAYPCIELALNGVAEPTSSRNHLHR